MAISMNSHSASNSYGYIFGVKELDHRFKGALDNGALIVIAGHPGSGKTTFASTICYANTLNSHRCLYITFQESREKLFRVMKRFGIHLDEAEAKGLLKFVKLPLVVEADEVFSGIANIINEVNPDVVVIDSITPILKAVRGDVSRRSYLQNYLYELTTGFKKLIVLVAELSLGKSTINLGDIEYVADMILMLRHRVERGLLIREMEIRKAREAPIDIARVYFSIVEGQGIKIAMPVLLEEIPAYDMRELYIECNTFQKAIGPIHKGFSIYIEYPADARPVHTPLIPLMIAYTNNLKVLLISYRYSESDMNNLLKRLIRIVSGGDTNIDRHLNEFLKNNVVLKGINPFSMSVPHLSSYELELVDRIDPDIVMFHGIEIPMKYLSPEYYIPSLYNQIMMLRKRNKIVVRMCSCISEESHNINSTLSDVVIRYDYSIEKGLMVYIWRRGSNPVMITEKELEECIDEYRENIKRRLSL